MNIDYREKEEEQHLYHHHHHHYLLETMNNKDKLEFDSEELVDTPKVYRNPPTLNNQQPSNLNQQQQQVLYVQQYHSPSYRVIQPTIEEDIQHQQQPIDYIRKSTSPTSMLLQVSPSSSQKRTHKRSSSHGPLRSTTSLHQHQQQQQQQQPPQLYSQPIIMSPQQIYPQQPQTGLYPTHSSPPNVSGSRPMLSPSMITRSSSGYAGSYGTWSPSTKPKKTKPPQTLEQQLQQLQGFMNSSTGPNPKDITTSPTLSPRSGGGSIGSSEHHRRTVSWEPLEGESLEALNQIIKEKKDALLMRERELKKQQKMLTETLKNSQSPPIVLDSSATSSSSNPSSLSSSTTIQNPSMLAPNPSPSRKMKHNRSKSDTNTIVKLHLLKKQPSNTNLNNYEMEQQQQLVQQYLSPVAIKSPKVFSPNDGSRSPRPHSSPRPISKAEYNEFLKQQQQQLYPHVTTTTTTTTTSTTSPLTPNYSRRKSVDPNTFGNSTSPINNHMSNQPLKYSSKQPVLPSQILTPQYLNQLMNIDFHEIEEEIDKEIQQVILQTKNIQGKVEMLERVRCTAPDPLLMLFGENCRNARTKQKKSSKSGIIGGGGIVSPGNIGGGTVGGNVGNINSPIQPTNIIMSSPSLVHYPPTTTTTTFIDTPTTTRSNNTRTKLIQPTTTRCPDRTKSKNISSVPRSSAFSPPPRS